MAVTIDRTNYNLLVDDSGSGTDGSIVAKATIKDVLLDPIDVALASVVALTGGLLPQMCQGRLTLTTALPVTTADVTAAGTIYFAPYGGNRLSLYDGSSTWTAYAYTQLSLALTLTSGKNYDVFAYNNSGTPALELSAAWTTDTARATALVSQDGVWVKTGATTRRYLGTLRASGANVTEDSATKRFVWNYYNRARRHLTRLETADSWTYTTATWRQSNNSSANQVEVVIGVAESQLRLIVVGLAANSVGGAYLSAGIGEDSTTTPHANAIGMSKTPAANILENPTAILELMPAVGYHYYAWLERSSASGTTTFYGDQGSPGIAQAGMQGSTEA